MEMSTLAVTLLRMAGIPTALSLGWLVEEEGKVKTTGHAWPEVIAASSAGKYQGLPVEVSSALMTEEKKIEKQEAVEQAVAMQDGKKRAETVAEDTGTESLSTLDRWWKSATPAQRVRISRSISFLETILELRGRRFGEHSAFASENMADVLLSPWNLAANQQRISKPDSPDDIEWHAFDATLSAHFKEIEARTGFYWASDRDRAIFSSWLQFAQSIESTLPFC